MKLVSRLTVLTIVLGVFFLLWHFTTPTSKKNIAKYLIGYNVKNQEWHRWRESNLGRPENDFYLDKPHYALYRNWKHITNYFYYPDKLIVSSWLLGSFIISYTLYLITYLRLKPPNAKLIIICLVLILFNTINLILDYFEFRNGLTLSP